MVYTPNTACIRMYDVHKIWRVNVWMCECEWFEVQEKPEENVFEWLVWWIIVSRLGIKYMSFIYCECASVKWIYCAFLCLVSHQFYFFVVSFFLVSSLSSHVLSLVVLIVVWCICTWIALFIFILFAFSSTI